MGDRAGPLGDVVGGDLLVALTSDDDGLSRFLIYLRGWSLQRL